MLHEFWENFTHNLFKPLLLFFYFGFLIPILKRKLAGVELKYGKAADFEKHHYALLALMCVYGIELLTDNITECRANLLEILADYLNLFGSHSPPLAA